MLLFITATLICFMLNHLFGDFWNVCVFFFFLLAKISMNFTQSIFKVTNHMHDKHIEMFDLLWPILSAEK